MDTLNNVINQSTKKLSGLNMVKTTFSGKTMAILIAFTLIFGAVMLMFLYFILDIIKIDTYNIVNQMSTQGYNIKLYSIAVGDILLIIPNIYMVLFIISALVIILLGVALIYIYIKLKSSDNNATPILGFKLLKMSFIAFIVLSILYSVPVLLKVNAMSSYINYIKENQLSIFDSVALSAGVYLENIITIAFYIISMAFAILYFTFMTKFSTSIMLTCKTTKVHIKGVSFSATFNSLIAFLTGMIVLTITLSSLISLSDDSFIPQEILTYISAIQYTHIFITLILFSVLLALLSGITICIAFLCYRYKSNAESIMDLYQKEEDITTDKIMT